MKMFMDKVNKKLAYRGSLEGDKKRSAESKESKWKNSNFVRRWTQ